MSTPRFHCPAIRAGLVELPPAEAQHALRSLRLRPGDAVELFDGAGLTAAGVLQPNTEPSAGGKRQRGAAARVAVEAVRHTPPPARRLTLLTAACKGDRLDFLIEKSTELDVWRIELCQFERSVVRVGAGHADGLARRAIEACKQCGRAWAPQIGAGRSLAAALEDWRRDDAAAALLVADPSDDAIGFSKWLRDAQASERAAIVIGPEGGVAPAESVRLNELGAIRVRLGPHVLRVETAALAAAACFAAVQ